MISFDFWENDIKCPNTKCYQIQNSKIFKELFLMPIKGHAASLHCLLISLAERNVFKICFNHISIMSEDHNQWQF